MPALAKKIPFELLLKVQELANIPLFDSNCCYMIITLTDNRVSNNYKHYHRSKVTTNPVQVSNHRCVFNNEGVVKEAFRIHVDQKTATLANKWLCVSFMMQSQVDRHEERLGTVQINLSEYANEPGPKTIRYLLDQSKTNSIAKLTLYLQHLADDAGTKYNVPQSTNKAFYQGIAETLGDESQSSMDTKSRKLGRSVTDLRRVKKSETVRTTDSQSSMDGSYADSLGLDLATMKQVCDEVFKEDTVLNGLINSTYRSTWQLADRSYEEFTPVECVRDIVEFNGNGWKKNDEGLNVMDVVKNEIRENTRHRHRRVTRPSYLRGFDREEVSFGSSDEEWDSESSAGLDSDDDDLFESRDYYFGAKSPTKKTASKVKRFNPPAEVSVRPSLRSWSVGSH